MRNTRGFTLIEVVVVMGILGILFTAAAFSFSPNSSASALGSRVFGQSIISLIKSGYMHSITGYSSRSSDEGVRDDANIIPSSYAVSFQKGGFYRISELQERVLGGNTYTRILWKDDKEYYEPSIELKKITLKDAPDSTTGVDVDDVTITFSPPFGALHYYTNNRNFFGNGAQLVVQDVARTVHEFPKQVFDDRYEYIELSFENNLGQVVASVLVGKQKQFFLK